MNARFLLLTRPSLLMFGALLAPLWAGDVCNAQQPVQRQVQQGQATQPSARVVPAENAGDVGAPAEIDSGSPFAVVNGERRAPPPIPMGDAGVIERVIQEAKSSSRVVEHARHLSEQIGHRLTGSSNLDEACRWAAEQFRAWGLDEVRLEPWGEVRVRFDKVSSRGRAFATQTKRGDSADGAQPVPPKPDDFTETLDLSLTTLCWVRGTDGPKRGRVLRMPRDDAEYERMEGQYSGAWVLIPSTDDDRTGPRGINATMRDRYDRWASIRADLAAGKEPLDARGALEARVLAENPLGFLSSSRDQTRVWTTRPHEWQDVALAEILKRDIEINLTAPGYDFINSRLADGVVVEAEFDLQHQLTEGPFTQHNVVGEIRGSVWPEQVVIVCGHLDSWNTPGSQGTTDNATGSATTMEAARVLAKALGETGLRPKRTIRFILWTGEEQGLLGAKAYVQQQKDNLERISAVFNDDGGTNFHGGFPAADAMVDMLAAATAPINPAFLALPETQRTLTRTAFPTAPEVDADGQDLLVDITTTGPVFKMHGGSDHAAFNEAGVPGFYWRESGKAYYPRGWHTQFDRSDLLIPRYLIQSAATSAVVAYNLACADELLPRGEKVDGKLSAHAPGSWDVCYHGDDEHPHHAERLAAGGPEATPPQAQSQASAPRGN